MISFDFEFKGVDQYGQGQWVRTFGKGDPETMTIITTSNRHIVYPCFCGDTERRVGLDEGDKFLKDTGVRLHDPEERVRWIEYHPATPEEMALPQKPRGKRILTEL